MARERIRTRRGVRVQPNRGLLIVDGDNLRCTIEKYGVQGLKLDRLLPWVSDRKNLGITKLIGAYFFLSVKDSTRPLPINSTKGWTMVRHPFRGAGYPDAAMYELAEALLWRYDTLVIASSDGGRSDGDGGVFAFADKLRNAPDAEMRRRVVVIASHLNAHRGWTVAAGEHVAFEHIYPELEPVIPWVMPRYKPPVSAPA